MGDKTGIEWTDATWNPVAAFDKETQTRGWFCIKKSEGCRNCYAENMNRWRGNGLSYSAGNLKHVEFALINLNQPLHWQRPRKIFVNSMTDLFLPAIPDAFIEQVFNVMYEAKWHKFQVLTKHPDRMYDFVSRSSFLSNAPLENVILCVSCEDQKAFDERWPYLGQTPAAIRGLSLEPLLGSIDIRSAVSADHYACEEGSQDDPTPLHRCWPTVDWVIVGGESGPGARPMNPEWARSLRDQCQAAGVAYFFKQWGEWLPLRGHREFMDLPVQDRQWRKVGDQAMIRVGKKAAGRLLDGCEWNEMPGVKDE